jgi:hypothetical protein
MQMREKEIPGGVLCLVLPMGRTSIVTEVPFALFRSVKPLRE